MSAPETTRRDPRPPVPVGPPRTGRLVLGVLLVLLGAAWFLESLDVVDIRWSMVLPAVLLVIGTALLATAHRGASGGLVGVGILVLVLVVATAFVPVPFGRQATGAGDVLREPATVEELEAGYALGAGSLEVDLRGAPLPDEPVTVEVSVGLGEVVVRLPEDVTVEVRARAGVGQVAVHTTARGGVGVEVRERLDGAQEDALLVLEVSTGVGQVEVRR